MRCEHSLAACRAKIQDCLPKLESARELAGNGGMVENKKEAVRISKSVQCCSPTNLLEAVEEGGMKQATVAVEYNKINMLHPGQNERKLRHATATDMLPHLQNAR